MCKSNMNNTWLYVSVSLTHLFIYINYDTYYCVLLICTNEMKFFLTQLLSHTHIIVPHTSINYFFVEIKSQLIDEQNWELINHDII